MMGVLNRDIRISRNDGDAISEISNFAESPLDPKMLWVGTDDGNVQVTTDGGATWTEVSGAITRRRRTAPSSATSSRRARRAARRTSRSTPTATATSSRTSSGRPTSARPGRRSSTGCQATTRRFAASPSIPGKPNVLFAGTERALFVTHDSGAHWARLAANLPTTRYDDIVVHPRTKDLVLGTHGRGIWILDDASPIAEWTPAIAAKRAHLFDVPRATLMLYWEDVSNMSHYFYTAENPAEGATFTYHLAQPAQRCGSSSRAPTGKVIRELNGPGDAGVDSSRQLGSPLSRCRPAMARRRRWWRRRRGRRGVSGSSRESVQLPIPSHDIGPRGPHVAPGTFKVTLEVDGVAGESRTFEVRADPASAVTLAQHKARETFVVGGDGVAGDSRNAGRRSRDAPKGGDW